MGKHLEDSGITVLTYNRVNTDVDHDQYNKKMTAVIHASNLHPGHSMQPMNYEAAE